MKMKKLMPLIAAAATITLAGCMRHSVETSNEIKPIHIVIDVNVKVDKALDNFFGSQDANANVMPQAVSLDDALKPVDPAKLPPREVMMGRFVSRSGEIRKLKDKGIAGEDAKGFISFVTDKRESEAVVAAENADRQIIYDRVSKSQGLPVEKVAEMKAARNAMEAKAGDYVQDASGKWSKRN